MIHVRRKITLALLTLCLALSAFGQDKITLHIGDPAPPLEYSKWIKGEPVASFDGNRLYVVEFWATWCGPCKAAMPHLTELQKEYKDKATFIGVNVWESHGADDKPYESYLPAIEKFVRGNAKNMGYLVIADNNEQFMANHWLKAAGINGIPASFIIQNKHIIWIGHPIKLDTTLPKILDGSYDMQAYKLVHEKRAEASLKRSDSIKAAMAPVQEALKAKAYQQAFDLMEKAKAQQPILTISLDLMKFKTLLEHVGEQQAMDFAEDWAMNFKSAPVYVLSTVAGEDSLSQSTYLAAAKIYADAQSKPNPVILHLLASCYAKGGDYKNATLSEEKAVTGAKTALKEGKMAGTIMDYTVREYEQALAAYKKGRLPEKTK